MLGRNTYELTKRDIQAHANVYTEELRAEILAQKSLQKAITLARSIAKRYHSSLVPTIYNRLTEIGTNAVEHYAPELTEAQKSQEVGLALDELTHNRYYGLTLPQRLRQSHLELTRNITRSGYIGAKLDTRLLNITRVFNDTYPFGAHKNWDTRLFLAEAVRLEHTIARNLAIRKSHKLIRWTLSGSHSQEDHCDDLAQAVDRQVETYIESNKLNLRPEGVYFVEDIPPIPHPNCQCVIKYVYRTRRGKKVRPAKKLNLIQRILKAIFK